MQILGQQVLGVALNHNPARVQVQLLLSLAHAKLLHVDLGDVEDALNVEGCVCLNANV